MPSPILEQITTLTGEIDALKTHITQDQSGITASQAELEQKYRDVIADLGTLSGMSTAVNAETNGTPYLLITANQGDIDPDAGRIITLKQAWDRAKMPAEGVSYTFQLPAPEDTGEYAVVGKMNGNNFRLDIQKSVYPPDIPQEDMNSPIKLGHILYHFFTIANITPVVDPYNVFNESKIDASAAAQVLAENTYACWEELTTGAHSDSPNHNMYRAMTETEVSDLISGILAA